MIKSEKGSVTLLVAITVLFIIIILSSSLTLSSIKRKSQLQETKILQEIYGGNNLNEIYQEQLEKNNYSNLISDSSSDSDEETTQELYEKYVDIGLDVNGDTDTTNDWELFYETGNRIFLISADCTPITKLEEWKITGPGGTLTDAILQTANTYNAYWSGPIYFELPSDSNFLSLVMHTNYSLKSNSGNYNSSAVSQLLNKNAWNGIKLAAEKNNFIDFVIGGPTIEMWCSAWNKAVDGDENGFVTIYPDARTTGTGYFVKHDSTSSSLLYVDGGSDILGRQKLEELGKKYKTFFPHLEEYENCKGYWIASPSADGANFIMGAFYSGCIGNLNFFNWYFGVRPVIALAPGVQLVEKEGQPNKFDIIG